MLFFLKKIRDWYKQLMISVYAWPFTVLSALLIVWVLNLAFKDLFQQHGFVVFCTLLLVNLSPFLFKENRERYKHMLATRFLWGIVIIVTILIIGFLSWILKLSVKQYAMVGSTDQCNSVMQFSIKNLFRIIIV